MASSYNRIFNISGDYLEAQDENLGGQIHNTQESYDAGIAVNGTEIINSSGVYIGTVEGTIATTATAIVGALTSYGDVAGEDFTASSTLTISGESQMQRIVSGGTVTASSSTSGANTITAAQLCDSSVLQISSVHPDVVATLPATSTLAADCLDTVGDRLTLLFMNTSALAATTTTITTNTDYQLLSDDANGDIIAGLDSAIITITRLATEMIVTVVPVTSAE